MVSAISARAFGASGTFAVVTKYLAADELRGPGGKNCPGAGRGAREYPAGRGFIRPDLSRAATLVESGVTRSDSRSHIRRIRARVGESDRLHGGPLYAIAGQLI